MSDDENERKAEICRNKAREAFINKDFDKANELLLLSERMYPTDVAKEFLRYIKDYGHVSKEDSDNKDIEKKEIAETCIEIARDAISIGYNEKAKQLLEKAERIYPTDTAKHLLRELCENNEAEHEEEEENEKNVNKTEDDRIEAVRCIDIAQKAISEKHFIKARKFLMKAKRLYPLEYADILLKEVQIKIDNGENIDDTNKKDTNKSKEKEIEEEKWRNEIFMKRKEAIASIKIHSNDPYEILGIERNTDESSIRKTIKRLKGLLHPDKNTQPGAEDAFRAVVQAEAKLLNKK